MALDLMNDVIQIPGHVSGYQDRLDIFKDGIPASNDPAVGAWSLSHGELVAPFIKRVP